MLKLKQIVLAIFGVVSSSVIFANSITPISVPNPNEYARWSFGAAALYLQPTFGGNGLGYSSYSNYDGKDDNGLFVGVSGASDRINNLDPKWGWGFQLGAAYLFNAKNDANIQWYHLNDNTNGHLPSGSVFSGSDDGFYAGRLQIAQYWNAVNIEMGHRISFDENKSLRLHAGVSYSSIKNQFTNYPQLFPTGNPIFITTDTMTYYGFGPRIGGDFEYTVGRGLSLYAKTAGAVLVGQAKQSISGFQNYINSIYGFQPYGTPNYYQSHSGVVVPELEAKLGVKYDYQIAPDNVLSFDLGYLWISYLHAITSYTDVGIVGTADGASIGTNTTANFDLNGVYLGIKWSV